MTVRMPKMVRPHMPTANRNRANALFLALRQSFFSTREIRKMLAMKETRGRNS